LNLIPDASVEIHLFCVDECSMAANGHQWENPVPLIKLAQGHLTMGQNAIDSSVG
jgi:hypothetical protein